MNDCVPTMKLAVPTTCSALLLMLLTLGLASRSFDSAQPGETHYGAPQAPPQSLRGAERHQRLKDKRTTDEAWPRRCSDHLPRARAGVRRGAAGNDDEHEAGTAANHWGQPDPGGVWDYRSITPMHRPKEFADRGF